MWYIAVICSSFDRMEVSELVVPEKSTGIIPDKMFYSREKNSESTMMLKRADW